MRKLMLLTLAVLLVAPAVFAQPNGMPWAPDNAPGSQYLYYGSGLGQDAVGKLDYYSSGGELGELCFSFKARNGTASPLDVTTGGNKKYALVFANSDTASFITVLGLTKYKTYKNKPWSNFDPFLVVEGCCDEIFYWTEITDTGRFYLVDTTSLEDNTNFDRTLYDAGKAICVNQTFNADKNLSNVSKVLYYTALIRAVID